MTKFILTATAAILVSLPLSATAQTALVPKPLKVTLTKSQPLHLQSTLAVKESELLNRQIFSQQLKLFHGIDTIDLSKKAPDTPTLTVIHIKSPPEGVKREAYSLDVANNQITIKAATQAGAFYATQTLLQLIETKADGTSTIPACHISDMPRFAWRGLMLDESRHFFGKKLVKHLIDTMAVHKMNKFHWHLTDNEGWRIEIKAYPKLTSIGAWHGEGTPINTPKRDQKKKGVNNPKYGGFYTQADIKEIVAYAAARHIEIIPEIDVPGHGFAFCKSYPEVLPKSDGGAGKDVQGLQDNVISVVREKNYKMLDTIFAEISALFPSPYIHVGGDEVNKAAWANSPEHRAFVREHKNGVENINALQNYFMLRLEKILKSHGKTLMGWNEIMHGGNLSKDTAVMAWISVGAGIHAAKKGHPTIMAPGKHTYFDMKYPGPNERKGHWWAGAIDTHQAYNWNPVFEKQLTPSQQKFIQGVHCCLWTEFVYTPEGVDYKLWPRACAIAEVGWTQQKLRSWDDFNARLGKHLPQLDKLHVQYRVKPPVGRLSRGSVTIQKAYPSSTTVYTLDGSEPTSKSKLYKGEKFPISLLPKLRFRTITHTGRMSNIARGAKRLPVGKWTNKDIKKSGPSTLTAPINPTGRGQWFAELRKTKGKNDLKILSAEIKLGSQTIVKSELKNTILKGRKPLKIKLPIKTHINPQGGYQLVITVQGIKGNKSHGIITFDQSPYAEPEFSVTTNLPADANNTPDKLKQYSDSSYFRSARGVKPSDTFVITFKEPITAKQIILPTGKPGTNTDILKSGILEYSPDGKTWKKGAPFTLGPATLKFASPRKIKAIRVKILAQQSDRLVIRAPKINLK